MSSPCQILFKKKQSVLDLSAVSLLSFIFGGHFGSLIRASSSAARWIYSNESQSANQVCRGESCCSFVFKDSFLSS